MTAFIAVTLTMTFRDFIWMKSEDATKDDAGWLMGRHEGWRTFAKVLDRAADQHPSGGMCVSIAGGRWGQSQKTLSFLSSPSLPDSVDSPIQK